jgi:hypothetical protein
MKERSFGPGTEFTQSTIDAGDFKPFFLRAKPSLPEAKAEFECPACGLSVIPPDFMGSGSDFFDRVGYSARLLRDIYKAGKTALSSDTSGNTKKLLLAVICLFALNCT